MKFNCKRCLSNSWAGFKRLLYHKKDGQSLFCGKSCLEWLKTIIFLLVFYVFIILLAVAFWFAFKAVILDEDLQRKLPYRKAFEYANEKIEAGHPLYPLKEEVDKLQSKSQLLSSHLDFPFLTHVPRRNDGGNDDYEEGPERRRLYLEQLRAFRRSFDKVEGSKQIDCGKDYVGRLKEDILARSCKENLKALDLCIEAWERQGNMTQNPCLAIKLNRVVGYLPKLYPDQAAVAEQLSNAKKQNHPNYPAGSSELVAPDYDASRIPIVCWHYIDGRQTNLLEGQAGDLIKLDPPKGISVRQFPYLNQKGFSQGFVIMTLNVNGTLKDLFHKEKITVECRAVVENIPYGYKLDVNPVSKYGHFRLKFEMYDDKGTKFFKLSV